MRLIDADRLIERIRTLPNAGMHWFVSAEAVFDEILNAPTIEIKRTEWIPCSERSPEEGERVLCTHLGGLNPNRQVIEHIYQNGKFVLGWDMDMNPASSTFGRRYMGKVIAWMPLPEPWKGETK